MMVMRSTAKDIELGHMQQWNGSAFSIELITSEQPTNSLPEWQEKLDTDETMTSLVLEY